MIYLDHAATTPVSRAALEAAWPFLTAEFGNPSSSHELGNRAELALCDARSKLATFFNCRSSEVTFTSGGTEGDNLAIIGLALANPRGKHLVSAKTEHQAVIASLEYLERIHGFEISWLEVDGSGQISPATLRSAMRNDTALVSLMLVNNETGVIHPIADFAAVAKEFGALFHTDAVQAAGWLDLDVKALGVDALSISGHKIGAPKGSGAVFIRGRFAVEPILHGGGQEAEKRSGTENVAWAVALGRAIADLVDPAGESQRVAALAKDFIDQVLNKVPDAKLTAAEARRSANIIGFTFAGKNGETILLDLERQGVICSSGSACAAGRNDPSHVLLAMGFSEDLAQTSVRFSLGHQTTQAELDHAVTALVDSVT